MEWKSFSLLYVFLFFIFHSSSSSTTAGPACHPDERSALLQLKSSLSNGVDTSQASCYPKTSSWKKNTNCCKWDGITCDDVTGHVIGLDLSCSRLKGPIRSNSSLFFLHHLQELDLSVNDFSGSPIVPQFGQFKNMTHLDLSYTNFNGNVPLEVSHLSKLVFFSLAENELLNMGVAAFKALAQNLTNLRELWLFGINMSSVPPVSLMNLSSSLTDLELDNCQLHGKLPDNIFQSYKLQYLWLSGNYLSGQIPWSSLNLEPLFQLDLSHNNFIGQIPEVYNNSTQKFSSYDSSEYPLGSFPSNLQYLDLSGNSLNGKVPSWIPLLPYLTNLIISDNLLTGEIPTSIFQKMVHLQFLDLSSNNFMVNMELEDLSMLKELTILDLSSNNLSWSVNYSINHTIENHLSLHLSSCNLIEFPSFLKSFKCLEGLDLSNNQIHGSVPQWLWELGKDSVISLNLSHNFLTYMEPLPWNKLQTLDLRSNFFLGPLPISSSPSLTNLLLSKNQFAGEILSSFCNMTSLGMLDLSYNNFSGAFPPCIENISSTLSVLDLRMNRFHGRVPPAFGKGCHLRTLNINGNQLEGSLPRSLLNCEDLEVLDIGDNKINGSFPQWLESLSKLQVLILKSNRFYGPISNPKVRFPFQKLRIMDLSNNEFTGQLPTKYFEKFGAMKDAHADHLEYMRLPDHMYYQESVLLVVKGFELHLEKILTIFTTIDFSRNNFKGEIPMLIGRLRSLKGLNFSHNRLSGFIPPSLGNLSNLEWLDLSSNKLSGNIPLQLAADLNQLEKLNLSNNKLEGTIPRGTQFNTFNGDSYSGNLGLCGFPLPECNNDKAQQGEGDNNGDQGADDNGMIDWKVVIMGYGSGLVIGISIGYMVLFSRGFNYWFSKRFRGRPRHISIAPLGGWRRN